MDKHIGSFFDCRINIRFAPDISVPFDRRDHSAVCAKLSCRQSASVHYFGYDPVFDVEFDIIAETSAERTCRIFDDLFSFFHTRENDVLRDLVSETAQLLHQIPCGRKRQIGLFDLDWDTFEIRCSGSMGL